MPQRTNMYDKLWPDLDKDAVYPKIKLTSNRQKGGWANGVYVLQGPSGNVELDVGKPPRRGMNKKPDKEKKRNDRS